jgi:hypothetical protein
VGLNRAPATFVSGELRLGAVAAKAAQRKLRRALDLLREPNVTHPGIRPGCRFLPRYPKPRNQEAFHSWVQMTYYGLFRGLILVDGRLLSKIPEELVGLDVPKVGGLVIFGAKMKGTNMRFFGAWLDE